MYCFTLVKHFDESSLHGDTVWEDLKMRVKTKQGMNEENSSTLGFSELQANVLKYALICTSKVIVILWVCTFNLQLGKQAHWQYASVWCRGLCTSNIAHSGVHKVWEALLYRKCTEVQESMLPVKLSWGAHQQELTTSSITFCLPTTVLAFQQFAFCPKNWGRKQAGSSLTWEDPANLDKLSRELFSTFRIVVSLSSLLRQLKPQHLSDMSRLGTGDHREITAPGCDLPGVLLGLWEGGSRASPFIVATSSAAVLLCISRKATH